MKGYDCKCDLTLNCFYCCSDCILCVSKIPEMNVKMFVLQYWRENILSH